VLSSVLVSPFEIVPPEELFITPELVKRPPPSEERVMFSVPLLLIVPELDTELVQPPGQLSSKLIVPLLFNVPVFEKLLELKIKLKLIVPVLLKVPVLKTLLGSNPDVRVIVPLLLNVLWLRRPKLSPAIVPELTKEAPTPLMRRESVSSEIADLLMNVPELLRVVKSDPLIVPLLVREAPELLDSVLKERPIEPLLMRWAPELLLSTATPGTPPMFTIEPPLVSLPEFVIVPESLNKVPEIRLLPVPRVRPAPESIFRVLPAAS